MEGLFVYPGTAQRNEVFDIAMKVGPTANQQPPFFGRAHPLALLSMGEFCVVALNSIKGQFQQLFDGDGLLDQNGDAQ